MISAKYNVKNNNYKCQPIWIHIILVILIHTFGPHGLYLAVTAAQWKTILYAIILYYCTVLGVTAGTHRLWSHRSYKAKPALQILFCLFHSMSGQPSIYRWARGHRLHHKHTDTDADPHSAARGFFFSHIGWIMIRRHPEGAEKLKDIDVSDLKSNPIVMFQNNNYPIIMFLGTLALPAFIPWYFWAEKFYIAWSVSCMAKYFLTTHVTGFVNSVAHIWGIRPYDKDMSARQSLCLSWATLGEGWHNYHHAFPQDYKASEFGFSGTNFSTAFIDLMAKIGWAYDLKTVTPKLIDQRANRTGDGTRELKTNLC